MGYVDLLTKEAYEKIPFEQNPITEKRDIFLARKLPDSIHLTEELAAYFTAHLEAIHTSKTKTSAMKYHVIVKEGVEHYVPMKENARALALAQEHRLTNLEFNFLNYFFETNKALRNYVGQLYYDPSQKGIGWGGSRDWVKKNMARLMKLGLVKFEARHDCRDGRYTSWYFYDATKSLDSLDHDF